MIIMATNIEANAIAGGHFGGTTLMQSRLGIGGHKTVMVDLVGPKLGVMYPTHGGILKNPFRGMAKAYTADLVEYRTDGTCYLLKTYEVAKIVNNGEVKIMISTGACAQGDIFRHIPFVGDNIMVAPATFDATGKAVTVTAVENVYNTSGQQTAWEITVSETLGEIKAGTVLVEAAEKGATVKAMVTNPNCYLLHDEDMLFTPATGGSDFDGARYFISPVLMEGREYAWTALMSPLPPAVKAMNTSKVAGWFKL